MKEAKGNMLTTQCDGIFITTNGFVKNNGECVMGRGIAKQIADMDRTVPKILGSIIADKGNHVHFIKQIKNIDLWSFPVKPCTAKYDGTNAVRHMASKFTYGSKIPGWATKADIEIIKQSVSEVLLKLDEGLLNLTSTYLLPRPGCGAGELNWEDIKPIMEQLPDNFICMTFK